MAALAPHLPDKVLAAAGLLSDEWERAQVLAALAPHLPDEVLAAAGLLSDEWERAKVLTALATHRPEGVYEVVGELTDKRLQADVLIALAPYLLGIQREEALRRALRAAGSLSDEWERVHVLLALAVHLPEIEGMQVRQIALETAQNLINELQQISAHGGDDNVDKPLSITSPWFRWVLLLQGLAAELPNEVFEATESLANQNLRSMVFQYLASRLPREVYAAAKILTDHKARLSTLIAVIDYLPGVEKVEALRDAFRSVEAIPDERMQAQCLIVLSKHLNNTDKVIALRRATELTNNLAHGRTKVEILHALASCLPDRERQETSQKALESVWTIEDERQRLSALIDLVPFLPKWDRENALRRAMELAGTIEDDMASADILIALAPHLPEAVYAVAEGLADPGLQAWVLSAVAPYRPEAEQAKTLHRAIETAERVTSKRRRVIIRNFMLPYLPEKEREITNQQVLKEAWELDDGWLFSVVGTRRYLRDVDTTRPVPRAASGSLDKGLRARALGRLAPYLLEATKSLINGEAGMRFMISLIPYLSGAEKDDALQRVLEVTATLTHESQQAEIYSDLIRHLPEAERARTLQMVLQKDKHLTVQVFIALAPYMPEAVYKAAESLADEGSRAEVLAALADYFSRLSATELYSYWSTFLTDLRQLARRDALDHLAKMTPVIKALGGEAALSQTLVAVEMVWEWWP